MSKRPGDYETARRLLTLVERVDRGGTLRLSDIQKDFDVKPAAAAKYRGFVQEVRPRLEERRGPKGVKEWYIPNPDGPTPKDEQRAAALTFALEALRGLEGTPHYDLLKEVVEAHRNRLGDEQQTFERLERCFIVRPVAHARAPNRRTVIKEILSSLEERCPCVVRYLPQSGEAKAYEVDPWGLVFHRDELFFLVGKRIVGERRSQRRLFSIDGIQSVERWPGETIRRPPSDLKAAFKHVIGVYASDEADNPPVDLHLRVRGGHAVRLQRRAIHSSQQISPADDGWYDLRLRVAICPQVRSWIRSMIPDVQVLAPTGLKDELRAELRNYLQSIDA